MTQSATKTYCQIPCHSFIYLFFEADWVLTNIQYVQVAKWIEIMQSKLLILMPFSNVSFMRQETKKFDFQNIFKFIKNRKQ